LIFAQLGRRLFRVKDTVNHDGPGDKKYVEELVSVVVIKGGPGEVVIHSEPKLREYQERVFEEIKEDEVCVLPIGFAPMVEEQSFQQLEFSDRVITCSRCLRSLQSLDTDANMGCRDHVDVIRAVSNCEGDDFRLFSSNKGDDLLFLFRGDSTAENGFCKLSYLHH
jgi:hypothetical protein